VQFHNVCRLRLQPVPHIERGNLVTFCKRGMVKAVVDEVIHRATKVDHRLADMDQLRRALANDLYAQHLAAVALADDLQIAPDNELLIVEARIASRDIDQMKTGQQARLRLIAFDNPASPQIEGEVTYLTTDQLTDEATGQPFYTARIALNQEQVARKGLELRSGMPVEI